MTENSDRGSVTAETAVVLPVLVLVAALAAWALAIVGAQLACVEAARAAARAAARGDPPDAVRRQARESVGGSAQVTLREAGGRLEVDVSARVPGPLSRLGRVVPGWRVHARATAAPEAVAPEPAW